MIKKILILLWRLWFYIWIIIPIIIALPILIISLLKDSWYPFFYKIARVWAKIILFMMGFRPKTIQMEKFDKETSYLFCPNHTSMMDIMLMLAVIKKPFVFVGKKELSKYPLFGFFYRKSSILVDRSSAKSRKEAFDAANEKLSHGLSVCIFPEGLVPEEGVILADFKSGAFRLAIEHQIPIVPITFYDCKNRFSYTFFSGSPGVLRVKIHHFLITKGCNDHKPFQTKTYQIIKESLEKDLE